MFKIKKSELREEFKKIVKFIEEHEELVLIGCPTIDYDENMLFEFGYIDDQAYSDMYHFSDGMLGMYVVYRKKYDSKKRDIIEIEDRSYKVAFPDGHSYSGISVRENKELQEEAINAGGTFTFLTKEESEEKWWNDLEASFLERLNYIKKEMVK
ncbi:MAG: hypothetical protein ACRDBY_05955 [Cetobacterium sp.]